MSAETPAQPLTPSSLRTDVQRRRREMALTARWLRELRGRAGGPGAAAARPAARFTRPVKH